MHVKPYPESAGHVGLDQIERAHLDAGEPVDALLRQALLEFLRNRLGARKADQRLLDPVALP